MAENSIPFLAALDPGSRARLRTILKSVQLLGKAERSKTRLASVVEECAEVLIACLDGALDSHIVTDEMADLAGAIVRVVNQPIGEEGDVGKAAGDRWRARQAARGREPIPSPWKIEADALNPDNIPPDQKGSDPELGRGLPGGV